MCCLFSFDFSPQISLRHQNDEEVGIICLAVCVCVCVYVYVCVQDYRYLARGLSCRFVDVRRVAVAIVTVTVSLSHCIAVTVTVSLYHCVTVTVTVIVIVIFIIIVVVLFLFQRENNWNSCPSGYFLSGLFRAHRTDSRTALLLIAHAWCCKPSGAPKAYKTCYEENISTRFEWYQVGMVSCSRPGYYITGLYRSNCHYLSCIKKFKCCELQVVEGQ